MNEKVSVKTVFFELFSFYKQTLRDARNGAKTMDWKQIWGILVSTLVISIAHALFCSLREGTGDLYMNVFIPLFFTNALIVLYAGLRKSSFPVSVCSVLLTSTGAALQIYMLPTGQEKSLGEAKTYVAILFFGILASMLLVPLVRFLFTAESMKGLAVYILLGATLAIYLFLFLFGREFNGTKAWISIGGLSLQLTEIEKLLALISIPAILCDQSRSEKTKSVLSVVLLCIHSVFLVLVNELGTLCIIFMMYFITRAVFAESRRYVLGELALFLILGVLALVACYGIYRIQNPVAEEVAATQHSETLIGEETVGSEAAAIEAVSSEHAEEQKAPSAFEKIFNRLGRIYPKIRERVMVFLKSDDAPDRASYQLKRAEKALMSVSLLGTPRGSLSSVPEIDCDFVFIYLIVRLGVAGVLIVFASLIVMLVETAAKGACVQANPGIYMTSFAMIFSIAVQALLCSCANVGLFPVIGLPFPFLSSGGSALCVNLFMSFFVISSLGEGTVKEQNNACET